MVRFMIRQRAIDILTVTNDEAIATDEPEKDTRRKAEGGGRKH
ncbi:MAG: hypothetical protein ACFE0J_22805 [Elainellaceae cyanobacterium]